jgi:hypothetical protein
MGNGECPKCGAGGDPHVIPDVVTFYPCGSRIAVASGELVEGRDCLQRQLAAMTARAEKAEAVLLEWYKTHWDLKGCDCPLCDKTRKALYGATEAAR